MDRATDADRSAASRVSRRWLTLGVAPALALALVAAVLVAPLSVRSPEERAHAASEAAGLWRFADRRAQELEPLWRSGESTYVMPRGNHSTRLLAAMLALHAYAAAADHVGASRRDERIEPLVETLTEFPSFVASSSGRHRLGQFHAPGWTENTVGFPSPQHISIDAEVATALAAVWQARTVVALSPDTLRRIRRAVTMTARSRFIRYPSVRLNQFNWNTDLYLADATITGDTTLLRQDYRRQLVRFVHYARRQQPGGSPNLNAGLGLRYLPQNRPGSGANRMPTSEYGSAVVGGLRAYPLARAAGMRALDARQRRLLSAWARRSLYGDWTHAGMLNWDTGLGATRWQLSRYWILALGGLGTMGETPFLRQREQAWARWMLQRALGSYEAYQGAQPNACMPSTLFGVRCSFSRRGDPLFVAARASAFVAGIAALPARRFTTTEPPAVYAYDFDVRRFAVTTPAYSTAVIDQTFATGYGGVGLARLFDRDGRPLGSIGGRGRWGFGLSLHHPDRGTLLDTLPGGRAGVSFRGPAAKRAVFRSSVRVSATVRGRAGTSVRVGHRFSPTAITTTYRIRAPRSGVAVVRLPAWSLSGSVSSPAVTRDGGRLTVRMRQQAGGYAAILRWRGSLRTRWVHAAARSVRSPGTAARLDVVLPLRDGRATVSVTLLPDPVPAAQGARADYERQSREALG